MRKIFFLFVFLIFIFGCQSEEGSICIDKETRQGMHIEQAKIAAMGSNCITEGGILTESYLCNPNTGTWWIDLYLEKEGCNPACVIDVNTGEAEINWRCTGLLE